MARAAFAKTEQIAQRLDDHIEDDDDKLGALSRDVGHLSSDVEFLRAEVREGNVEIGALGGHVGNLRVDVARMLSTMDVIKETLADQRQIKHVTMIAEVETGKAKTIAKIEDTNDARKTKRALLLSAVAGVGYLIGWLIGK